MFGAQSPSMQYQYQLNLLNTTVVRDLTESQSYP